MKTSASKSVHQTSREGSAGWMISIVSSWIEKQIDLGLNPMGLSKNEFAIIMILLEGDGLTQVEIGNKIAMPGYATTRNLDKLEILNLLKRCPHESSRRSHRIYLTPQGKTLGPSLISITQNINEKILDALDEDDRDTFRRLLSQVVESVAEDTSNR